MELSYYKSMEPFWGVWKIRRLIGEGSFGKVFEIEREDFGRTYRAALKAITIPQSQSELKSVLADGMDLNSATNYYKSFVEEVVEEFALMAGLKGNSNIVSYEDHMVIEHKEGVGWDILIRMELLTPLLDYTSGKGPMGRGDIIHLGMDICKALEYCRKMNIIHRDIKPENIFISQGGDYKLGDFGIARTVEKTTSGLSRKGTYVYMAPEVYKGEEYGPSVDIYSLGIVLYRLLNQNRAPFFPDYPKPITHSDRENAIARRISGQDIPMPCDARDALGEVVLKACAYAPKDRYATPEEMRLDLQRVLEQTKDVAVHVTKDQLEKLTETREETDSYEETEMLGGQMGHSAEAEADQTERDTEIPKEQTGNSAGMMGGQKENSAKMPEEQTGNSTGMMAGQKENSAQVTEQQTEYDSEVTVGPFTGGDVQEDEDTATISLFDEVGMEGTETVSVFNGFDDMVKQGSVQEDAFRGAHRADGKAQKSLDVPVNGNGRELAASPDHQTSDKNQREPVHGTDIPSSAGGKTKKKKTGVLVAVIVAAILFLLLAVILGKGLLGGSAHYDDISTYEEGQTPTSIFDETEESAESEVEEVEVVTEEAEEPAIPREMLYGVYVYDMGNSDTVFEAGMDYKERPFGETSVLPGLICFAPDGTLFDAADVYYTGWDLDMTGGELFQEMAVDACGETVTEETEAIYDQQIRGQMDVAQMAFVTSNGDSVEVFGYYRLEGSNLKFYYPAMGILDHLCLEPEQYTISFSGRNLELSSGGVTRTLVPYEFSAGGQQQMSGYACTEADAYEGMAYIGIENILETNPLAEIRFTDGSVTAAPIVSLTGENTLTIRVEEKNINKVVQFLSCGEIGFILQEEGKNYLYQKTKADFYREKLSVYADDLDDDDIKDLDDDVLTAMAAKKEEIGEGLKAIFAGAGMEADGQYDSEEEMGAAQTISFDDGRIQLEMSKGVLTFSYDSLFDGEGKLTEPGKEMLDRILPLYDQEVVEKHGDWLDAIYIKVYLDSSENHDSVMAISELGADLLYEFCEIQGYSLEAYLEAEGCGDDFPVFDENGNENRERSRRVVISMTLNEDAFITEDVGDWDQRVDELGEMAL